MAAFHTVSVADIKVLTPESKIIYFTIPDNLQSQFVYSPGQYISIEAEVNGKKERRAYSICTSPYSDHHIGIGVKEVEGGKVSTYLNRELKVGDTLKLFPPMGNFTLKPDTNRSKSYVFIGAGSGVTPLMSILKSVLLQEPNSHITFFYCNRNESSVMFGDELNLLADTYPSTFTLVQSLTKPQADWAGLCTRFDKGSIPSLLRQYVPDTWATSIYFICGPSGMILDTELALQAMGIDKERILKEYFSAPLQLPDDESDKISDRPLAQASLEFKVDGRTYQIPYKGEDSILVAALDNDIDAPYACQVGACCTCRAKLKEGKVVMADRESLSDQEIEEGYILTCQSKPLTSKLVYSYDE